MATTRKVIPGSMTHSGVSSTGENVKDVDARLQAESQKAAKTWDDAH